MQLLSLADLGPEAQRLAGELSYKTGHDYSGEIVVFAAITVALWIAAAWIAAQAVSKENADMGRAVKTGFLWTLGFLTALALGGTAFYFARLRGNAPIATASLAITGILLFQTAVGVPMKVHRIHIFKAFGFALIGIVVHLAAQLAVQKAMHDPLELERRFDQVRRLAALPAGDAAQVLAAVGKPAAAPAPAPAPTPKPVAERPSAPPARPTPSPQKVIADRHDELKKMYADLMARRETLKEGDDAALAAYTRDTARYTEMLAQLQKDSDALKK